MPGGLKVLDTINIFKKKTTILPHMQNLQQSRSLKKYYTTRQPLDQSLNIKKIHGSLEQKKISRTVKCQLKPSTNCYYNDMMTLHIPRFPRSLFRLQFLLTWSIVNMTSITLFCIIHIALKEATRPKLVSYTFLLYYNKSSLHLYFLLITI